MPPARTRLALLLSAVALLAAGCGAADASTDPSLAATVDGEEITVEELEERFAALRENPQTAAQLEEDPDGTIAAQAQAELLSDLIRTALLTQAAEDELDFTVGEEEIDEQRELVVEQLGGQEGFDAFVEEQGLTEEEVDLQLGQLALNAGITERLQEQEGNEVSDTEVAEFYEQNAETQFGPTATVRHILVEDEAAAQAAVDRLNAGEDFATVAEDVSTDPGSAAQGGELGAISRGQTVPEFEEAAFTAPLNEPTAPVQTQFGFHILEVTARNEEPTPLSEVEDQIREQLQGERSGNLAQEFLQEQSAEAEVTVNPRFGTWNAELGQVVPEDPLGDATPGPQDGPAGGAPAPGAPAPGDPVPGPEGGAPAPAPTEDGAPATDDAPAPDATP